MHISLGDGCFIFVTNAPSTWAIQVALTFPVSPSVEPLYSCGSKFSISELLAGNTIWTLPSIFVFSHSVKIGLFSPLHVLGSSWCPPCRLPYPSRRIRQKVKTTSVTLCAWHVINTCTPSPPHSRVPYANCVAGYNETPFPTIDINHRGRCFLPQSISHQPVGAGSGAGAGPRGENQDTMFFKQLGSDSNQFDTV